MIPLLAAVMLAGPAIAAECFIDLTKDKLHETPSGWRSTVAGSGPPGDWKVVLDDLPPTFAPLTPNAPQTRKVPVIAQRSRDPTDERFPLLVYEGEVFRDFTLTLRFKIVGGGSEQMAGVAFRWQDERNYYVVRASSLGRTFRFYRVHNGTRDNPIGPEVEIPAGVWHGLSVQCQGNRIRLRLDDRELIPDLTDSTFSEGKIALWTKSDSVSYFTEIRIDYVPREPLAAALVREALQRYPRLLALRVFAPTDKDPQLHIVASKEPADIGKAAGQYDKECIAKDQPYAGKKDGRAIVAMPLHDRNGDAIASVHIEMESFPGQTDQNVLARALPVVRLMEGKVRSLKELAE